MEYNSFTRTVTSYASVLPPPSSPGGFCLLLGGRRCASGHPYIEFVFQETRTCGAAIALKVPGLRGPEDRPTRDPPAVTSGEFVTQVPGLDFGCGCGRAHGGVLPSFAYMSTGSHSNTRIGRVQKVRCKFISLPQWVDLYASIDTALFLALFPELHVFLGDGLPSLAFFRVFLVYFVVFFGGV